jgi:hypothetical protein
MFHVFYWSPYDAYSEESLLFACAVIAIGLLAFRVGSSIGRRKMHQNYVDRAKARFFMQLIVPRWRVLIFLVITLLLISWMIGILGVEFFTSSRDSKVGQVDSLPELGFLLELPRALGLGVLLVSIALLIQRWRHDRGVLPGVFVIFVCSVGINAIVNYPLSVARYWIFGFIISLMWIVYPLTKASLRSVFILGMTAMQFTILPLYSQITRDKGWIGGVDVESIRHYLHHGDFDGYQSIVNALLYIHGNGYELGRNLASVVFFFVPRFFWESKAMPLGIAAADNMGYVYTNLSAPIYAEFYADFGFFSLIFVMFFFGWGIRLADGFYNYSINSRRYGVGMLLVSVVAGYLIILLRGSLLGVVPSIATLFAILTFASWLSKPRKYVYKSNDDHLKK